MPYIIDGNNLIGCSPDIELSDPESRNKLISLLRRYQRNRNNKIILVFDGEPDGIGSRDDPSSKFTIRYPTYGHTADEEIKRQLSGYTTCKDVVLVTSDRELKTFARDKGARTVNSIEFYFELKRVNRIQGARDESQKRIEASISNREVDQWLKIFDCD